MAITHSSAAVCVLYDAVALLLLSMFMLLLAIFLAFSFLLPMYNQLNKIKLSSLSALFSICSLLYLSFWSCVAELKDIARGRENGAQSKVAQRHDQKRVNRLNCRTVKSSSIIRSSVCVCVYAVPFSSNGFSS